MPHREHGRWLWWLAPLLAATAVLLWSLNGAPSATAALAPEQATAAVAPAPRPVVAAASAASAAMPWSSAGVQARQVQVALWQQRLERAQAALQAYRDSTRYPFESRPIAEHPDQVHPFEPVVEEHPLRMPGGKAASDVHLRTTQERVFVQGREGVHFTVALLDDAGKTMPLRVQRAAAHEVPATNTGSLYPNVPLEFNDEGRAGDTQAGDGVYGVQLQPAAQGFDGLLGQIRVEVYLEYRGQLGFTYFDIFYTSQPPATWQGSAGSAVADGSLVFTLPVQVREAGRYVVTGRVDDANGKPFALLTFNDEVATGAQAFRLSLFGKLLRDAQPAFPLTLRDVQAFLLRPDGFPDRSLMPSRAGAVHTTASYPLTAFSEQEWQGEERNRYLAELSRDVNEAQQRLKQLGGG